MGATIGMWLKSLMGFVDLAVLMWTVMIHALLCVKQMYSVGGTGQQKLLFSLNVVMLILHFNPIKGYQPLNPQPFNNARA